jgi:hypothetical protein
LTDPLEARPAPYPPKSSLVAIGILTALLAGCGGGGTPGDPPATPLANVCGSGRRISSTLGGFFGPAPWFEMQNQGSNNCPYPLAQSVYATCLTVTAIDRWDETGNGAVGTVYVQDTVSPTPQYAALSLFDPSFSPPDLRVLPGDVLDVTGDYEEFVGPSSGAFPECQTLPQIGGSALFRYDGKLPAPVEINPADLNSYDNARKYLNMLVSVKNVTILADGAVSSGRYSATVTIPNGSVWAISDELFDVPSNITLHAGDTFDSVTGIVTYFYSFHLAPRSLADFKKTGGGSPDAGADGG